MAADTPPGVDYNPGANISVSLMATMPQTVLVQAVQRGHGGRPVGEADVGRRVRDVVDQFGVSWMVNITEQGG